MNLNLGKQKFFVIYQITNLLNGKIYVGAHCTYDVNDKYMGSSKHLKKDIKELGRQNFAKEILHVFDNKEDMMAKEAEIVDQEFCHRTDTYNRMIGGITEMLWNNMVSVRDKDGNYLKVYNDDPRYLSGEFVGCTNGFVPVKDVEGNFLQVAKDDPRYLSGELVSSAKGIFNAKDKDGNVYQISNKDIRWLSGELVGLTAGLHGNCAFSGKKHSEETKAKIGKKNSLAQSGSGNSMFGKKQTKESNDKRLDKMGKSFFVFDTDGNFISQEFGINQYANKNNLTATSIVQCLKGKQISHKGFKFLYENI